MFRYDTEARARYVDLMVRLCIQFQTSAPKKIILTRIIGHLGVSGDMGNSARRHLHKKRLFSFVLSLNQKTPSASVHQRIFVYLTLQLNLSDVALEGDAPYFHLLSLFLSAKFHEYYADHL